VLLNERISTSIPNNIRTWIVFKFKLKILFTLFTLVPLANLTKLFYIKLTNGTIIKKYPKYKTLFL
jgi:hypothetical protein